MLSIQSQQHLGVSCWNKTSSGGRREGREGGNVRVPPESGLEIYERVSSVVKKLKLEIVGYSTA